MVLGRSNENEKCLRRRREQYGGELELLIFLLNF